MPTIYFTDDENVAETGSAQAQSPGPTGETATEDWVWGGSLGVRVHHQDEREQVKPGAEQPGTWGLGAWASLPRLFLCRSWDGNRGSHC